jgi:17beta-estradiol 17-dehydrogenase / very-long-chain 3-oxoacyl-CoA reductase
MDSLRDIDIDVDQLAVPATQLFAFIGLLWLSLKILSFWRLIASLFILPGISVCVSALPSANRVSLTDLLL